jgi:hypothetical protein
MPAAVPIVLAIVVQIVVAWLPCRVKWKVSGEGCNAQPGRPAPIPPILGRCIMFVRLTVLAATLDPRSLVPVTPVDADGRAWFAIVDSVKPVHPDNGDPDLADLRTREAAAIRSGGMRMLRFIDGRGVVSDRGVCPVNGDPLWLAIGSDSYIQDRAPINCCYPCLDAIRYA